MKRESLFLDQRSFSIKAGKVRERERESSENGFVKNRNF